MPGCILRVVGKALDAQGFLEKSGLEPYSIWQRGDAKSTNGARESQVHECGGFKCDVSRIDGDLRGQLADAVEFLSANEGEFMRIAVESTVDECELDFAIESRLGKDGVAVQCEDFPIEFLELVGRLKVAVVLSVYPAMESEQI